jgi:hypothetical protein
MVSLVNQNLKDSRTYRPEEGKESHIFIAATRRLLLKDKDWLTTGRENGHLHQEFFAETTSDSFAFWDFVVGLSRIGDELREAQQTRLKMLLAKSKFPVYPVSLCDNR